MIDSILRTLGAERVLGQVPPGPGHARLQDLQNIHPAGCRTPVREGRIESSIRVPRMFKSHI
jgi:hypothetical protein